MGRLRLHSDPWPIAAGPLQGCGHFRYPGRHSKSTAATRLSLSSRHCRPRPERSADVGAGLNHPWTTEGRLATYGEMSTLNVFIDPAMSIAPSIGKPMSSATMERGRPRR